MSLSIGKSPLEITGRIILYFLVIFAALFFLIPFFVMVTTSIKTMNDIRTGHLISLPRELTIDAWINLRPTSDWGFIVSRWDRSSSDPKGQFILDVYINTLRFICANGIETFSIAVEEIPFEQWILVSAVFDNGQMALFVDGEQRALGQAPFATLTPGEFAHDDLNIGDHWRDLNYPYTFEGMIDEVRLSNISRYVITEVDDNEDGNILPFNFELSQNYPNPFNPATSIEYSIPTKSHVTIEVFNILGQRVRTLVDHEKPAGSYNITWDGNTNSGNPAATGLYVYRFQAGEYVETKKMMLLK